MKDTAKIKFWILFIQILNKWKWSLFIVAGVLTGGLLGLLMGQKASIFKPLGDIFLNLLFTAAIPLVFFSLSSAVVRADALKTLGKIAVAMILVFALTGVVSSVWMLSAVKLFYPAECVNAPSALPSSLDGEPTKPDWTAFFAVSDISQLFSRKHMPALMIFSLLVGAAAKWAAEKAKPFADFLTAGSEVCLKMVQIIMFYAPIGLAGYFADLVGNMGQEFTDLYLRSLALYYPVCLAYFFVAFSAYIFFGAGRRDVGLFWRTMPPVALTAWATGSSLAALPVNLMAAERMDIRPEVRNIVLPIGATIHMDGSAMAAILKIALLFALYGRPFSSWDVYGIAIGVALLSGTVMSGIPGGGFLGEMLIVSVYQFPPESLALISVLGIFVDPPATMVNAVGDAVAACIIDRRIARRAQL